jgi:hypothetical protein
MDGVEKYDPNKKKTIKCREQNKHFFENNKIFSNFSRLMFVNFQTDCYTYNRLFMLQKYHSKTQIFVQCQFGVVNSSDMLRTSKCFCLRY